jgi:hypothetical protein
MNYITRKGGATVTVFVPYDCNNHCPFCINKAEYADRSKFKYEEVIRSIKIMSVMAPECDFVFTGGEPLANCLELEKMLIAVHQPETKHKVFINTTLPTTDEIGVLASYLNFWYKKGWITGVNVSRHLRKYVEECNDEIFDLLDFEPRINCVLYNLDLLDKDLNNKLINFVKRFREITGYIQFRKDYVVTTLENLYDEDGDEILNLLKETFVYKGSFGRYRMRVGYEFDFEGYKITYHKTLPYSKLPALYKEGTKDEIPRGDLQTNVGTFVLYDIIIKQDGSIKEDWDTCSSITFTNRKSDVIAKELNLNAYRKVKYEDYK